MPSKTMPRPYSLLCIPALAGSPPHRRSKQYTNGTGAELSRRRSDQPMGLQAGTALEYAHRRSSRCISTLAWKQKHAKAQPFMGGMISQGHGFRISSVPSKLSGRQGSGRDMSPFDVAFIHILQDQTVGARRATLRRVATADRPVVPDCR